MYVRDLRLAVRIAELSNKYTRTYTNMIEINPTGLRCTCGVVLLELKTLPFTNETFVIGTTQLKNLLHRAKGSQRVTFAGFNTINSNANIKRGHHTYEFLRYEPDVIPAFERVKDEIRQPPTAINVFDWALLAQVQHAVNEWNDNETTPLTLFTSHNNMGYFKFSTIFGDNLIVVKGVNT